jgi:hypothetical protein
MAASANTFEFGSEGGWGGSTGRIILYLLARALKSENLKIKLP